MKQQFSKLAHVAQFGARARLHSIHAFTHARTFSNVTQVNSAIRMASDEQLRVAGHWRDAHDSITVIVTCTNGVHHLVGRVHDAHFNVFQFVNGH
jgi:hypothetical protein